MSVRRPAVVTTTVRGFPLSLQAAPDYTAARFVYIVSRSLLANCSLAQCHIVTTTERTCLLAQWSRSLPEKPAGSQLVRNVH